MKTLLKILILTFIIGCNSNKNNYIPVPKEKVTDDYWKNKLNPIQYYVLRENGTELAFSGEYYNHFEDGNYACSACDNIIFNSTHKYPSDCGWPTFDEAIKDAVIYLDDNSHNMKRTEVRCGKCNSHLGHIFLDGPQETTGERYCINSVALKFIPK